MQIVQTLNDFIKILFTPSTEGLCLGDFLLVQEADERFLGQIIEVEDDKFDKEKAVARVKLTHSINLEGEIVDFNYHTPSKQCEVLYANTREIFDFVNQDKRTFKFGEDFKYSRPFEFNLDFFKNSPLIFCDTIKEHNNFSAQLSKKLSDFRNVILIDYTGSLEVEGAQRLRAKVDFKLPLDYFSLDYIWEKGLASASLETQAVCEEIFNEVKSFVKMTKDKFIPFNRFLKVIGGQYKSTPVKELLVLKNRLQNYQQEELFANVKSEFTWIFEQIGKEKITIIDLSPIKSFWHKDFTEFILRNIKIDSYVFMRLNDSNFDFDLLNLMYLKNRKYSVIPSISNLFAKLPIIAEHCPNCIIFPTKNLRKDFGSLEASICAMPEGTVMLYGKDSNNFAFLVKNLDKEFEDEEQKAKKQAARLTFEGDVIKNLRVKDKITRLNDQKQREIEEEVDKFLSSGIKIKDTPKLETTLVQSVTNPPPVVEKTPAMQIAMGSIQPQKPEPQITLEPEPQITMSKPETSIPVSVISPPPAEEQFNYQIEDVISEEDLDLFDALNQEPPPSVEEIVQESAEIEEVFEEIFEEVEPEKESIVEEPVAETPEVQIEEDSAKIEEAFGEIFKEIELEKEPEEVETKEIEAEEVETKEIEAEEVETKEIQDEEPATEEAETKEVTAEKEPAIEEAETQINIEENIEEFLLEDIADESIHETFEEIIDADSAAKNEAETETISEVEPETESAPEAEPKVIPVEEIPETISEGHASPYIEEIPIFTPEIPRAAVEDDKFSEGDKVLHDNYGEGEVLQIVEYSDKVLLQIEFERIGKRLLDPVIAGIRKIRT